jgi:hypothetical protein
MGVKIKLIQLMERPVKRMGFKRNTNQLQRKQQLVQIK